MHLLRELAAQEGHDDQACCRFKVQGSGFRAWGSRIMFSDFGCIVQGVELRIHGLGIRVLGSDFRIQDSGFRFQGSGFKV